MVMEKIWRVAADRKIEVSCMILIIKLVPLKIKIDAFFEIYYDTSVSDIHGEGVLSFRWNVLYITFYQLIVNFAIIMYIKSLNCFIVK